MKCCNTEHTNARCIKSRGFTLVEIIFAMAISSVIVAAIYSAYTAQQRIYIAQNQIAELQQTTRAGNSFILTELRMAGYDNDNITTHSSCNFEAAGIAVPPGVLKADNDKRIDISSDLNGDGDCADKGENLSFYLYTSGGVQKLGRNDNTDNDHVQPIAKYVDELEFHYLDATESNTNNEQDVRAIQISLLTRARQMDRKFTNSRKYCPGSNPVDNDNNCEDGTGTVWGPYNDNYRRRLLITTINLRNLGLQ